MKKKTILNICMVLTILLVAVCGVMAVGSIKGWGNGNAESGTASDVTVAVKTGIAMIERSGVAYEVSEGTVIRKEDQLYTKTAAALTIAKAETSRIYMGSNAELAVSEVEEALKFEVMKGEALVDARGLDNVTAISGDTEIAMNQAVATISTQAGSSMVYVYAGEVALGSTDSEEVTTVSSGKVLTIVEGAAAYETADLRVNALSDAQMAQLAACGMDETFCFTEADLKEVQEAREAEILKAQQEAIRLKEEAVKKAEAEAKAKEEAKAEEDVKKDSSAANNTATADTETTGTETDSTGNIWAETDITDDTGEATTDSEEDYQEEAAVPEEEYTEPETDALSCTIEIRCDTILDNKDNLAEGKEGYVPYSGTILGTTLVEFSEDETVFDVLQRVCDSVGIQIEYSYTPLYESYYIEGINHLYEFDCGNESGWMYKVNGWFPNYGCSSYYLQDGDAIVWCYTCKGLGADVGDGM